MKPTAKRNRSTGEAKAGADAPPPVRFDPSSVTYDGAAPCASKDNKPAASPAPPPVWTRYIDSRLKQFCTR